MTLRKNGMKIRVYLLSLYCALYSGLSFSNHLSGQYAISALYGINYLSPYTFESKQVYPGKKGESSFKLGYFSELALSRNISQRWSLTLLGEYQSNASKSSSIAGNTLKKYGHWSSYSALLSSSFSPWPESVFSPFVSAGAGGAIVDVEETAYDTKFFINDHDLDWIWQIEVGAQTKINSYLSLIAEIQHFEIVLRHDQTNSEQDRQFKNTAISFGFHVNLS